jgi:hypothetical protein
LCVFRAPLILIILRFIFRNTSPAPSAARDTHCTNDLYPHTLQISSNFFFSITL